MSTLFRTYEWIYFGGRPFFTRALSGREFGFWHGSIPLWFLSWNPALLCSHDKSFDLGEASGKVAAIYFARVSRILMWLLAKSLKGEEEEKKNFHIYWTLNSDQSSLTHIFFHWQSDRRKCLKFFFQLNFKIKEQGKWLPREVVETLCLEMFNKKQSFLDRRNHSNFGVGQRQAIRKAKENLMTFGKLH